MNQLSLLIQVRLSIVVYILVASVGFIRAQDTTQAGPPLPKVSSAPVIFEHDTLFSVYGRLGPFTAEARAEAIRNRLYLILSNDNVSPDSIRVETNPQSGTTEIVLDSIIIMTMTTEDVVLQRSTPEDLAAHYAATIRQSLLQARISYSTRHLLTDAGIALGIIFASSFLLWIMTKIFPVLYKKVETLNSRTPSIRLRSYTITSGIRLNDVFILLLKGLRLTLTLCIVYFASTFILSLFPWTKHWNIDPILRSILIAGLLTVVTIVLYRNLHLFARYTNVRLRQLKETRIKPVRLKTAELVSSNRIVELLQFSLRFVRLFFDLVLFYFYITLLFSLFTFTQTWATILFTYITTPLYAVFESFTHFLPNLFVILVTTFVALYLTRFTRWIFEQIENGSIEFPHFYAEWARPTYGIVRLLIIVFVIIIIFPYLPGSGSPAFQNVSLFLGLLLSISSASAVANAIAGVVITYMRPFRVGDRVKIADTMGDVVEKSILVTRVRTIKNVEITIPNAMVLSSHIINFSTSAQDRGLILNTKITVGYEVPWRQVHELLFAAATRTEGILADPKPFVLQTALNDFAVEYEINLYTNQPSSMAETYSALYGHIQDTFNEAGIEIISPHYSAVRDGNQSTIPQDYLPPNYETPSFRLFGNLFGGGRKTTGGDPGETK
jgi:small-conductance mechanosensitive channel